MTNSETDPVAERLRNFAATKVPKAVRDRLTEQLQSFRQRLADHGATASSSAQQKTIWLRWSWRAAAVAAVALLAIAVHWATRPNSSLAQAVAATMQQPWIHTTGTATVPGVFDRKIEIWFSAGQGIAAMRSTESPGDKQRIEFHDFATKTHYTYFPAENNLVKSTDRDRPDDSQKEVVILDRVKDQLLAGKSLADLDLFGANNGWKIVDQKSATVVEDGHQWTDVRLEVQQTDKKESINVVCRLDPVARLFHRVQFNSVQQGKAGSGEFRFEYPQQGPADIYALGVPKTARLIDSSPSTAAQRIVDQHRADIQRMDAYRAVIVSQMLDDQGNECQWFNPPDTLLEHKQNWFRSSHWSGSLREGKWSNTFAGYQKPYQTGDDPRAWWLDRIHDLTFIPSYLTRDGMQYQYEVKTAPAAQGAPQNTITAVHSLQDSYAIPPYYGQTPEFACRPPMGIGRDDLETSLDLKPVGGPPGCVLLRQHRLIREEAPYQRPGTKSGDMLFWLDPARGNAVVRTDDMALDPDGKEFTEMSIAVEDLAQSPSGVWYATKVRTTQMSMLNGQETKSDGLQNIYVDFDAQMPDELFAVPVVGANIPSGR